jgi:tRNA-binding EMAP/Myf-like protein
MGEEAEAQVGVDDFSRIDVRVGTIVEAAPFPRRASPRSNS